MSEDFSAGATITYLEQWKAKREPKPRTYAERVEECKIAILNAVHLTRVLEPEPPALQDDGA
jgi:hypothetical protein